jgi:hypothetical protein
MIQIRRRPSRAGTDAERRFPDRRPEINRRRRW